MSEVAHSNLQDIVDVTSPEDRIRWIERLIIIEQTSEMYRQHVHTSRINLLANMCGYDEARVEKMRRKVKVRSALDNSLFTVALNAIESA
jgi:hypothetical protein